MNVLKKIVIPRTNVTITYILSELEEIAREEFHRLKKVKEKKGKGKKMKDKGREHEGLCPVCVDNQEEGFERKNKNKPASAVHTEVKQQDTPVVVISSTSSLETAVDSNVDSHFPDSDLKIEYIKKHINELIVLGKSFVESEVEYIDIEEFIGICENVKAKIEDIFMADSESPGHYKEDYITRINNFKGHLRNVIELAKDLKDEPNIEQNIDSFIHECERVDEKLNETRMNSPKNSDKLQKLDSRIDDVVKITKEYKKQGLLSPSVEEFVSSCKAIKLKIKEYSEQESKANKITHLKEHVNDLEMLTNEIKRNGLESKSIKHFSKSCEEFKNKLDNYTKQDRKGMALSNLIEQIDETIGLSMEAEDIGLVGESIEDFVKSSEKLKKRFTPLHDTKSKILHDLKTNIDDVMTLIDRYKEEGLVSNSVEDFLRACEVTRNKIEGYEAFPPNYEIKPSDPACFGKCVSCSEPFQTDVIIPNEDTEVCKSCHKIYQKEKPPVTPCVSCTNEMKEVKLPSDLSICETCSNITEPLLEVVEDLSQTSDNLSHQEVYCDLCKKVITGSHEHEPPTVDNKASYFEKKIRKVTKVTRSQNPDGTIREEKETISIRKVKRNPTETSFNDYYEGDDEDDFDISDDDETQVAVCTLSYHHEHGFPGSRLIKSETELKTSSLIPVGLRSCISVGTLCLNSYEFSQSRLTIDLIFSSNASEM